MSRLSVVLTCAACCMPIGWSGAVGQSRGGDGGRGGSVIIQNYGTIQMGSPQGGAGGAGGSATSTPPHGAPFALRNSGSPAETVRVFYAALSRADGDTASALVVPEKRGVGAFDPGSISYFYGNLREPLRVRSIQPIGPDTVQVTYRFIRPNGTPCLGNARVTTVVMHGETLIQKISANC